MNAVALRSFGFGEQLVRVVDRAGSIWFVANDVCGALEIQNPRQAVTKLEADERDCVTINDAMGRERETTIVSESGLYALIFRSRKPIAVQFRKWVTSEVLPAIRETGRYEHPAATNDDRIIDIEEVFGSERQQRAINTAIRTVQVYTDLYGQQAGRDMMKKFGFPTPGVNLPAAPNPVAGYQQVEGDFHQWTVAVGVKRSRRDATHLGELYESYTKWCAATGALAMHPDRFAAMMRVIFTHEEHPEMFQVVVCRR